MNRWKRKKLGKRHVVRHATHTRTSVDFSTFFYRYDIPEQQALACFNFLRFYPDSDGESKHSAQSPNGHEPVESLYSTKFLKVTPTSSQQTFEDSQNNVTSKIQASGNGTVERKGVKSNHRETTDSIRTKGAKYWSKIRETKLRKSRRVRQSDSPDEDIHILATERRCHSDSDDIFLAKSCYHGDETKSRLEIKRKTSHLANEPYDIDSSRLATNHDDNSLLAAVPSDVCDRLTTKHNTSVPIANNINKSDPLTTDHKNINQIKTDSSQAKVITAEFRRTRSSSVEIPDQTPRRKRLERSKTVTAETYKVHEVESAKVADLHEASNFDAPVHAHSTSSREPSRELRARTVDRPVLEPIPEHHSLLVRSGSLKYIHPNYQTRKLQRTKSVDSGEPEYHEPEHDNAYKTKFIPLPNFGLKIPATFVNQTVQGKPASRSAIKITDGSSGNLDNIPTKENKSDIKHPAPRLLRTESLPSQVSTTVADNTFIPIQEPEQNSHRSESPDSSSSSSSNYSLSNSSSSESGSSSSSSSSSQSSTSPETILENPPRMIRSKSLSSAVTNGTGESTLWARPAQERKVGREKPVLSRSKTMEETKTLPRNMPNNLRRTRSQSLSSSLSLRDLRSLQQTISDDELYDALERSIDIHSLQTTASRATKEIPMNNETWVCRRFEHLGAGETRL